jgi:hypothetical protein
MAQVPDLAPETSPNETFINASAEGNQTYFAPYEVPVEIVVLLSLFYGAISLVAVLGNYFLLLLGTFFCVGFKYFHIFCEFLNFFAGSSFFCTVIVIILNPPYPPLKCCHMKD